MRISTLILCLLVSIKTFSQVPMPLPPTLTSNETPVFDVGFSGLPQNIDYLNDAKYTISKDFFDSLFVDRDIKGIKISFKVNNVGLIVLSIQGLKDDVISDNFSPNLDRKSYSIYPNEILTGKHKITQALSFGLENLDNMKYGYVKSYIIGRAAIYGAYNNINNPAYSKNTLVFKIAKSKVVSNSIYDYLYLVVQRKNSNEKISFIPFTSTKPSFFIENRSIHLPMGVGGTGNGGSKPCPPFGCNE